MANVILNESLAFKHLLETSCKFYDWVIRVFVILIYFWNRVIVYKSRDSLIGKVTGPLLKTLSASFNASRKHWISVKHFSSRPSFSYLNLCTRMLTSSISKTYHNFEVLLSQLGFEPLDAISELLHYMLSICAVDFCVRSIMVVNNSSFFDHQMIWVALRWLEG